MGMSIGLTRMPPQILARLLDGDEEAEEIARDPEGGLDLDKFWHMLHFAVTGKTDPFGTGAGLAVMGGAPVDPDSEDGGLLYLTAAQVKEIAADLATVSEEQVRARGAGKFPSDINRHGPDPQLGEMLVDLFRDLRGFYASAAADGQAVVAEMFM